MKTWKEYENNIFNYFQYFKEENSAEDDEKLPKMSVISYNASMILDINDRNKFVFESSKEVSHIFSENNDLKQYKFYLLANKEVINKNSKVENYLKIWKEIKRKYDIEEFILGPEVKIELNNVDLFSSIAEVPINYLYKAIEIISNYPSMYTLFISKHHNIMTDGYIKNMVKVVMNNSFIEINYFQLCKMCCDKGDIAIRYGTTFEEAEIALIYNPEKTFITY